jgi:hypothetical protein
MLQWLEQDSASGTPFDHRAVRDCASELGNRRAGKNWSYRFTKRNPQVVTVKPAKLDPKRAYNFNEAVVADFYDKLQYINYKFGDIPPEHIHNMDEKGIQMGGGRTNNGRVYMYFQDQKNRYKIGSDNLELVTVVECISASGEFVPPSFVLSEGPLPSLSKLPENSIFRYALNFFFC